MKLNFHLAASVVSLGAALLAAPAAAQSTGSEGEGDIIIVTGSILQSQEAALEEKRRAPKCRRYCLGGLGWPLPG